MHILYQLLILIFLLWLVGNKGIWKKIVSHLRKKWRLPKNKFEEMIQNYYFSFFKKTCPRFLTVVLYASLIFTVLNWAYTSYGFERMIMTGIILILLRLAKLI